MTGDGNESGKFYVDLGSCCLGPNDHCSQETAKAWEAKGRTMFNIRVAISVALLLSLTGCSASCQNAIKHEQSAWFGLNRTVKFYGSNGEMIRSWKTTTKVENHGGSIGFLDKNGKLVIVSGSFTVEED